MLRHFSRLCATMIVLTGLGLADAQADSENIEMHHLEATRTLVPTPCGIEGLPRNDSMGYCAHPGQAAALDRLTFSVAAAIARMPEGEELPNPIEPLQRWRLLNEMNRACTRAPDDCVALLSDWADAWDTVYAPVEEPAPTSATDPRTAEAETVPCEELQLYVAEAFCALDDLTSRWETIESLTDQLAESQPDAAARLGSTLDWALADLPDCHEALACLAQALDARIALYANLIAVGVEPDEANSTPRDVLASIQGSEPGRADRIARLKAAAEELSAVLQDTPQPTQFWLHDEIGTTEKEIAIFEAQIAAIDRAEGRVYRGLWFWSHFENPARMRVIFRGNRSAEVPPPGGHFYRGQPLEPGQPIQWAVLTQWARSYAEHCGHLLGADAVNWEITDTQTVREGLMTSYGYLPTAQYTTTRTLDRYRVEPALAAAMERSRSQLEQARQNAVIGQMMQNPFAPIRDAIEGRMFADAARDIEMHIRVARDMNMLLVLGGCDSPTSRQFRAGILAAATGHSTARPTEGAAFSSDPVAQPGQLHSAAEGCWRTRANDEAGTCHCLGHYATRDAADPGAHPAAIYRDWRARNDAVIGTILQACQNPLVAFLSAIAR